MLELEDFKNSERDHHRDGDEVDENSDDEDEEVRIYNNLKTLVKQLLDYMDEYKERGVGWDPENHEPKFFIADAILGERNLEIKIGYSSFNENKTIILIFTDTTQSYKVARLQDNDNFKNNLLASISHELRTPLNGTISLIEVAISSGKITEELVRDLLLPALSSTKRLEYFVKDISDFNDLHQDKFALSIDSWEIRPVLEEIVKLIRIPAESKGLELDVVVAEDVPNRVFTDADRMCQILINLLSNSLRFTNHGKISLQVSMDIVEPNLIKFNVRDTGAGMSEGDKDRLLNLLDSGKLGKVSQSSTGASLGIAISNALSNKIGRGLKLLSSEVRKGSHFQFTVINNRDVPLSGIPNASISSIINRKRGKKENRSNEHTLVTLKKSGDLDSHIDLTGEQQYIERRNSEMIELKKCDSPYKDSPKDSPIDSPLEIPITKNEVCNLDNFDLDEENNNVVDEFNSPSNFHNFPMTLSTGGGSKLIFSGGVDSARQLRERGDIGQKRPPSSQERPGSGQGRPGSGQGRPNSNQGKKKETKVTPQGILPPITNRSGGWMDEAECSCPEILVVDDEQINQIAMEWILRKLNIRFESALNGLEALKMVTRLEQKKCGCRGTKFMLLDLGMPEMDGYETAIRLKDMMIKNEIKGFFLVACTAYVGEDVKKKCIRSGFDDFVNKPLTIDKVTKLQQKYSKKHMRPSFVA